MKVSSISTEALRSVYRMHANNVDICLPKSNVTIIDSCGELSLLPWASQGGHLSRLLILCPGFPETAQAITIGK